MWRGGFFSIDYLGTLVLLECLQRKGYAYGSCSSKLVGVIEEWGVLFGKFSLDHSQHYGTQSTSDAKECRSFIILN